MDKCRELQTNFFKKRSPFEMHTATMRGNLDNMKRLLENGCTLDFTIFGAAVRIKDLNIIKWLYMNSCPYDRYIFRNAMESGNLNIMKWLLKNGFYWDNNMQPYIVEICRLDNMKWLLENICSWDYRAFIVAVDGGNNFHIVNWLLKNGCPWYEDIRYANNTVLYTAASYSNLDNIKYLLENGLTWDKFTFDASVSSGILVNMKWFLKNGCSWSETTYTHAAECHYAISEDDELNLPKWLLENGCPWGDGMFSAATEFGRSINIVPNMKWFLKNGFSWDERATYYAEQSFDEAILEWLLENGCPTS